MKKYISLLLFLTSSTPVHALGRFSVQLGPSITYSRAYVPSNNNTAISSSGVSVAPNILLRFDYPLLFIRDTTCFSTGLGINAHRVAVAYPYQNKEDKIKEVHKLYSIEAPLLLKLYTGEIVLDTQAYLILGPVISCRTSKPITYLEDNAAPLLQSIHWFMISGLLGIGVEYATMFATSFFVELRYQGGLNNTIKQQNKSLNLPEVSIYSDSVSLGIGVKL